MSLSDVFSKRDDCCELGGSQRLPVTYRFFTIFTGFVMTDPCCCKQQERLKALNHVLTDICQTRSAEVEL